MRRFSQCPALLMSVAAFTLGCRTERLSSPLPAPELPRPLPMSLLGPPPDVRPAAAGMTLPVTVKRKNAVSIGRDARGIAAALATSESSPSLVWFATDGTATIWKMEGTTGPIAGEGGPVLSIPAPWKLVAAADLNGDGHPDLIWEEYTQGTRAVTFMNGGDYAGSYAMMFQFSSDWKIVGAIDFNSDGKPDLVLSNCVTGNNGVLFMNGAAWAGTFEFLPFVAEPWAPVVIADMTGDSKPDMLMSNGASVGSPGTELEFAL